MMRILIFLILLMSLISCGKKKKNNEFNLNYLNYEASLNDNGADSDFDGLSDTFEIQHKMNKDIADLPEVEMQIVTDLNLNTNFYTDTDSGFSKNQISFKKENQSYINQLRQKIAHKIYENFVGISDANLFPTDLLLKEQKCLSQKEKKTSLADFKKYATQYEIENHHLSFGYNYKFKLIKNLKTISKVETHLYLNKTDLGVIQKDKTYYNFENENLYFKQQQAKRNFFDHELKNILVQNYHHCISSETLDFNYQVKDKKLNYKQKLAATMQNNAHIVIIHENKLIKESVNPKAYNIESFFNAMKLKYKIGKFGNILSLNSLESEFNSLDEIDFKNKRQIMKRKWFYLSSSGALIPSELKAGELYIFAHLSAYDILKVANNRRFYEFNKAQGFQLEDVYIGDRIVIESKRALNPLVPASISKMITSYITFRPYNAFLKGCSYKEVNTIVNFNEKSLLEIKKTDPGFFSVVVGKNKRKIEPKIIKDKLLYEIQIKEDDLVDNRLSFEFPKKLKTQATYKQHKHFKPPRNATCAKKRYGSWSENYTKKAPIELLNDLKVEHFGMLR